MSKIIPKLNLNKTPQLVENNSLVYAKNIKLNIDGTISPDTSLKYIPLKDDYIYIGHIIGVNNIVYLFGIESNNSAIFEYNELDKRITQIECAWKWSGGSIDGIVTTNNTNEKILTICEYSTPDNIKVPIKHINLSNCSYNDDESIYTQNPNIPISNIINVTEYPGINIPNGVYQFFIRYEIKKDIYTEWFSCSKEIYVGQAQIENTIQGSVKHIDIRFDSPNSFQFQLEYLNIKDNKFKKCQLGFIISNNDSVVARSWKYFSLPVFKDKSYIQPTSIVFDYKNVEEIDIYELLKTHYEIFNVNNITYFKNREYISNYIETDFNIDVKVEGNVKLETNDINLISEYYIGNKPISNNGTSWGNEPIKNLLSNQKYVELNQLSLEDTSPTPTNKITLIKCTAKFDNDWVERYYPEFSNVDHKRNIYAITNITKCFNINEDNLTNESYTSAHLHPENIIGWGPTNTYLRNNKNCWINEKKFTDHPLYYEIIGIDHLLYLQNNNGYCYFNNGNGFTVWGGPSNNFIETDYNTANKTWLYLLNEYCVKNIKPIIITKIELLNNNNNIIKSLFDKTNTTNLLGIQINDLELIKDKIIEYLINENIYINNSGIFCINNKEISSINVHYNKLTFEKNTTCNEIRTNYANYSLSIIGNETNYVANYKLQVKLSTFKSELNTIEDRTLMPFTDYEFYIHFVKQNGIITNGYKLGDNISHDTYTNKNALQQIYPNITITDNTIVNLPKDYVAWFVSIYDPKYTIARTFNHWVDNEYHYLECLECDSLLYNLTNNITIYQQDENGFIKCSDNGEYFSSSQTRELALFGNSGIIRFPKSDFNAIDYVDYEVITNNVNIPYYGGTLELQINFSLNNQIILIPIKDINDLCNLHNNIINNELLEDYINYLNIDVQIHNQSINDIGVSDYYIINNDNTIEVFNSDNTKGAVNGTLYIINEDEYEYNLKQLEIYNVGINNANLATNIRTNQFELNGNITGCGSTKYQPTAITDSEKTINRDCPLNPPTILDLVVGSATANTLADASTITGEDIKLIKDYINTYNTTLKNINEDQSNYIITRIKNGKTTIECSSNVISNTELLTRYKAKVIVTSKANESKNPIYAIYLNYNFNKKIDNYTLKERLRLSNTVIAKRLTNSFWIVQKPIIKNINIENKKLTRITPYISITTKNYNNARDMNLPAFLCSIMKPDFNTNNKYYVNGTDVYNRNLLGVNESLDLNESYIPFTKSDVFYTISNFNLNKLSLRENLTSQIRNVITETPAEENKELTSIKETLSTQHFKAFNTLVISTIYELKSMYRDYIKPYYKIADTTNNITKFNNTIRASNVNRDEAYFNVYKFDAENYYNIPTDRGIITKLFTILNEMFVHTEHALYKFAGNNNLKSTEGDVILQQTDIFDTGIQPILDSNHGFAGLLKKHHGVITHNNYVFYDGNINKVFTLDTQNGISYITDSINKLLDQYVIDDVIIATDNQNDRVYINFIPSIIDENEDLNEGKVRPTLCLSYSFRSKAFVSIHDLTFESAFGTHRNTYLINSNNIYQTVPYIKIKDNKQYSYYDKCFVKSIISTEEESKNNFDNTSCIDILYNEYYETIKVLNHINWITAKINSFNNNYMAEENLDYHYAGDSLKLYTDSCNTDLIPLNKIENDYNINDNNKHKFPRFNCGVWSLNYFRNIRNDNSISNNQNIAENLIVNYSHDNSLIYGKYFVLRILFNSKNNFKFENVNFNTENYGKI